ncbi:hypothetical protein [Phenylobacterium soli]|uniref:Uncharacterized protein n=1 Tax=Phenylobacterium soli TaxID=2170551 RepID=A0A328ALD1_9CAUL|nr:hypothetical protein [Phenylobacterium soli]RAK55367.1 hypothetical protein DJ017_13010 [Phenylobacterium soli]
MRASTFAFAMMISAASVAGVASAAGYSGYHGYHGYHGYSAPHSQDAYPRFPEPPKPPKPPEFHTEPRFKPFKGQHVDSPRGGLDPYPAAKKPKGGFSTYGD